MPAPPIGTTHERRLTLDPAAVQAGATFAGDVNPLHHDEAFAKTTRFGGLIASGAHTAALLAGFATTAFGQEGRSGNGSVGVDYNVGFRAPVLANQPLRLEWTIAAHEPRRSGTLARLTGGITDAATNTQLLTATMSVLFFD